MLFLYFLDNLRRNSTYNSIGFHILSYNSTCGYNSSVADGHASEDGSVGSTPYVPADVDGA